MSKITIEPSSNYWGIEEEAKPLFDKEALTRTDLYTLPTEFGGFTYPKEWDGEGMLTIGFDPKTGMASGIPPMDAKEYPSEPLHPRFNITAEDIDRKCSEAN